MSEMMQSPGSLLLVGLVAWLVWQPLKRRAMLDISGRWFVVTGCDSGIGAGVVKKLVEAEYWPLSAKLVLLKPPKSQLFDEVHA